LLGGDIHVSVDSTITDNSTGATIRHITTSPITNNVSNFFPALEGKIGDRYAYVHKAFPNQRTFCTIDLTFEEGGAVRSGIELVCVPSSS